MRILVTGANGFLGSHIIEKATRKGFEIYAGIRQGADLANLDGLVGYTLLTLNYQDQDQVVNLLSQKGPFDLIIHNVGVTKSFSLDKYLNVNVGITEKLTRWVKETKALTSEGKFVYISSMAARGPVGNHGPASNYGESKLKAEEVIQKSGLNYMIYRPTGIYGARDIQFLPLIKSVKLGIYPLMTSPRHKMTLINARDVAENVLELSQKHKNKIVHLDDGNVYQHSDLKSNLERLTGRKSFSLFLPGPVVLFFLFFSDLLNRTLNRTPAVSIEQYKEISGDWDFDFTEERKNIPLTIGYPLYEGFKDALTYYRTKKLL